MSCHLPGGHKRPVLDVDSHYLIYLWNVPKDLPISTFKTQGQKFGRVKFVETFEAWQKRRIGQVIMEFTDKPGLDKFVEALSEKQILVFVPPIEFHVFDTQLGQKSFFDYVHKWSGVDLLACRAIPDSFNIRPKFQPSSTSSGPAQNSSNFSNNPPANAHSNNAASRFNPAAPPFVPSVVSNKRPLFPSDRTNSGSGTGANSQPIGGSRINGGHTAGANFNRGRGGGTFRSEPSDGPVSQSGQLFSKFGTTDRSVENEQPMDVGDGQQKEGANLVADGGFGRARGRGRGGGTSFGANTGTARGGYNNSNNDGIGMEQDGPGGVYQMSCSDYEKEQAKQSNGFGGGRGRSYGLAGRADNNNESSASTVPKEKAPKWKDPAETWHNVDDGKGAGAGAAHAVVHGLKEREKTTAGLLAGIQSDEAHGPEIDAAFSSAPTQDGAAADGEAKVQTTTNVTPVGSTAAGTPPMCRKASPQFSNYRHPRTDSISSLDGEDNLEQGKTLVLENLKYGFSLEKLTETLQNFGDVCCDKHNEKTAYFLFVEARDAKLASIQLMAEGYAKVIGTDAQVRLI